MNTLITVLKKLGILKNRSNRYLFPGITLLILVLIGAFLITVLERNINEQFSTFLDGLWWALVTITTVGYGDKFPVTTAGKMIALVVMLGGIGTFGYIAGSLLEDFINKGRGLVQINYKDHYVICDYSFKAKSIIEELTNHKKCDIVLVADRSENPLQNKVSFVKGDTADENILKNANIKSAKTVIVLADGNMEESFADAHSVLSVLTIRHLNPEVKIIAEVLDPTNNSHFERAGADDIISSGEISSSLIVRASLYESGSKAMRELITNRFGNEIYDMNLKKDWSGKRYKEIFKLFKSQNRLLIGFARGKEIKTNPSDEEILKNEDVLIYIA